MSSIAQKATDPRQYDKNEIQWNQEGAANSPIRRLFVEVLQPVLSQVADKHVLDIGCGQGWLCANIAAHGGYSLGIEPSVRNLHTARAAYPSLAFSQADLLGYRADRAFDIITAIMVFEHFLDLTASFRTLHDLLTPGGQLVIIMGDFEKYTHVRTGCEVQIEYLAGGEAATRTDYGERSGIIYDIHRSPHKLIYAAQTVGLQATLHQPIVSPQWLLKEVPRYKARRGKPQFHLLLFQRTA
jgi:SAM-dependent methyltransferase